MKIRKARFTDIEAIHAIVNGYAEEGQMLSFLGLHYSTSSFRPVWAS